MSGICKVHGRYEGDWCYKCPPLAAPPATCNHRNAHELGATEVWCSSCKKMVPVAPAQPPQLQHGRDCEKVPHVSCGYGHAEEDDSPYDVDGVEYCGRCHRWMSLPVRAAAELPRPEPSQVSPQVSARPNGQSQSDAASSEAREPSLVKDGYSPGKVAAPALEPEEWLRQLRDDVPQIERSIKLVNEHIAERPCDAGIGCAPCNARYLAEKMSQVLRAYRLAAQSGEVR